MRTLTRQQVCRAWVVTGYFSAEKLGSLVGFSIAEPAISRGKKRAIVQENVVIAAPDKDRTLHNAAGASMVWQPVVRRAMGDCNNSRALIAPMSCTPPCSSPWAPVAAVETQHLWHYLPQGAAPAKALDPSLQRHITAFWAWRSWWICEGSEKAARRTKFHALPRGASCDALLAAAPPAVAITDCAAPAAAGVVVAAIDIASGGGGKCIGVGAAAAVSSFAPSPRAAPQVSTRGSSARTHEESMGPAVTFGLTRKMLVIDPRHVRHAKRQSEFVCELAFNDDDTVSMRLARGSEVEFTGPACTAVIQAVRPLQPGPAVPLYGQKGIGLDELRTLVPFVGGANRGTHEQSFDDQRGTSSDDDGKSDDTCSGSSSSESHASASSGSSEAACVEMPAELEAERAVAIEEVHKRYAALAEEQRCAEAKTPRTSWSGVGWVRVNGMMMRPMTHGAKDVPLVKNGPLAPPPPLATVPKAIETARTALQNKLLERGRELDDTPRDGHCLFHALRAGGLLRDVPGGLTIPQLRALVVSSASAEQLQLMAVERRVSVDEYKRTMLAGGYGDNLTIAMLARVFSASICVISPDTDRTFTRAGEVAGAAAGVDSIWIAYNGVNHYYGVKVPRTSTAAQAMGVDELAMLLERARTKGKLTVAVQVLRKDGVAPKLTGSIASWSGRPVEAPALEEACKRFPELGVPL